MKLSEASRNEIKAEYRLSPRELELLDLILEGVDSNAKLAERMHLRTGTVKQYMHVLLAKFRVSSKVGLVVAVCETAAGFDEI